MYDKKHHINSRKAEWLMIAATIITAIVFTFLALGITFNWFGF